MALQSHGWQVGAEEGDHTGGPGEVEEDRENDRRRWLKMGEELTDEELKDMKERNNWIDKEGNNLYFSYDVVTGICRQKHVFVGVDQE